MRDARGEQFRSSRVPFFGIHRGPTSRRAATLGHAQPSATTPQNEAVTGNPATASLIDADQMRKGSFFTSPSLFHQVPRPSVSPALVSGIRIRTSA